MIIEFRPTLLIVDDETSNIEILANIFYPDYEVLFATEGKKALEIALSEKPDLILLDILMPGMDGYQVCHCLRNTPDTEQIPIIFITALDAVNAEIQGLSIGAIDYITKPFSPAIIKMRVQKQIELKFAHEHLNRLATTDGLTGLANRRQFDTILNTKWDCAKASSQTLGIGMIDVDLFKLYNDYYGHLAGDECLRTVASVFSDQITCHSDDLAARYGGEEFVFITSKDKSCAFQLAESICLAIQQLGLPHALSPFGRVTVSIGVACFTTVEIMSAYDLIYRADEALLCAKRNGRNQAILTNSQTL